MTAKEKFIEWVAIKMDTEDVDKDIVDYFEKIKTSKPKSKFTEKGRTILIYMRENKEDADNLFTAKLIGEGLNVTGKTVAGSMRKLIADGYVEKSIGGTGSVAVYMLTELGDTADLDA